MGESIWTYDPIFALSIVAAALYLIPLVVISYQTFIKYRAYYFTVVPIGALLEVGGYAARAVSIKHLDQIVRTPQVKVELTMLTSYPRSLPMQCKALSSLLRRFSSELAATFSCLDYASRCFKATAHEFTECPHAN